MTDQESRSAPESRVEEAVNQPSAYLQRYYLLHELCGEPSASSHLLARMLEDAPLDLEEARIIARGWGTAASPVPEEGQ